MFDRSDIVEREYIIMVVCNVSELNQYFIVQPLLEEAVSYFQQLVKQNVADGTYTPETNAKDYYVKFMTNSYKNDLPNKAEAHRDYIDVQIILSGTEIITVPSGKKPAVEVDYQKEDDYLLYAPVEKNACKVLLLAPGDCAIFFPEELHSPCHWATDEPVRKAIIKVKYRK